MRLKIYAILLLLGFGAVSCYEDKGNYDYKVMPEITIENLPAVVEVLGGADHIVVSPKVVSSAEGEILEGNPNFEFSYKIERQSGGRINGKDWVDLNPSKSKDLDTLASFAPNDYIVWFKVTDLRTGIETSASFSVRVSSPTSEGWLVLCNEGAEERVRLDMIAVISADRITPAYDIVAQLGYPETHHATAIGYSKTVYYPALDFIYLMSEEHGAYKLNANTFISGESYHIYMLDFVMAPTNPNEHILKYATICAGGSYSNNAFAAISNEGNVYILNYVGAGSAFELPVNTSVRGGTPEFKVAPFVGRDLRKGMYGGTGQNALFYDIDNKRFMGWFRKVADNLTSEDVRQTLQSIPDPATGKLFSFNTGMELIHMESTQFSGAMVYSILQDASGKRVVYGINMSGSAGFVQEAKYENLNAPDFNKATAFAFHSKFPYMFYAVGNKVYLHNLGTNTTYPMNNISLGSNEEVTLLKFNYYEEVMFFPDPTEEYLDKQHDLIVASYDNGTAGVNGGKVGFYTVNGDNTITKQNEYTGFAKVKDIVYRER